MSFLNPLLLFGLAAVAVPIIIHLLNRRKFRKIDWAAMKFVKLSIDQNQRRMKLEDLILLLLRCALLALLALALARPVMRQSESSFMGQAGVTSVLVLDNSFSMGLEDGEATRFERAKAACTNILDSLPSGSSVALYLGSDVVRPVIEEPVFDLDAVREGILPKDQVNDLGIICSVWLAPTIVDVKDLDHKVLFDIHREGMKKAIAKAMRNEPSIDWLLENQDQIVHKYYQMGLDGKI